MWESLATPRASGARDRRFKSDHTDCYETYSGGSCVGTGRRLLIAQTQVRFLLPELLYVEGQADWRRHSVRSGASVKALRVQLSLLPPCVSEMCHWPSGKGTGLPIRSGRFDSDMALCLMNDIRVSANGKPAAIEAVHWRFESFRLCFNNKSILRRSNCWSLRLALNQKLAGSIPASGAVAVLYWFRNLAVNQVYVGSIPIGHPTHGRHPAG